MMTPFCGPIHNARSGNIDAGRSANVYPELDRKDSKAIIVYTFQDFLGAEESAGRIEKTMPPTLIPPKEGQPPKPPLPPPQEVLVKVEGAKVKQMHVAVAAEVGAPEGVGQPGQEGRADRTNRTYRTYGTYGTYGTERAPFPSRFLGGAILTRIDFLPPGRVSDLEADRTRTEWTVAWSGTFRWGWDVGSHRPEAYMHTSEGMRPGRPPQMGVPLHAVGRDPERKGKKQ